jgi:hypothetical protein
MDWNGGFLNGKLEFLEFFRIFDGFPTVFIQIAMIEIDVKVSDFSPKMNKKF